ncbi:MAG: DUF4124 domain-containing protein [Gammaproteobacteria bacterium]|nr:DUF4124 domain-containing protein [Gammaproteobacteria bacterium]
MKTNPARLLILALLLAPAAMAGTYKWVDENGKVHYSDKPVEGAEEVKLPELPTYEGKAVATPRSESAAPAAGEEEGEDEGSDQPTGYESFGFISPKEEQVFWNIGLKLPVQLSLSPSLRPGDRVKLFLNGQLKAGPSRSLSYTLDGVHRGTWTIRAVVEDARGSTVATAGPVKFFVRQTSVAN